MPGLSDAQETELNHLAAVIGRIVAAGTPTRLEATGVLECLSPGRRDYEAFAVRFACLPVRLLQLRKARKVVVNPKLPASMGANTRTSTVDGQLVVLDLELPPSLLVGNPKTRTARAITLLHELSHAVGEEEGLPIRDYTYRSSWAWRYLPDPVSWHNADTYADAAAQLAGELEQTPDRYLSTGCAVARRETLRDLPKLPLGTALAWADLKVNRAWLRSNDYQSFAVARSAPSRWDDDLAEYQRDLSWSGLAELEGQLQALGVVGRRWGFVNWGLDDADVRTAQLIYPWLNKVKDNLGAAIPQLSASATKVTYEAATAALTIPRRPAGPLPEGAGRNDHRCCDREHRSRH